MDWRCQVHRQDKDLEEILSLIIFASFLSLKLLHPLPLFTAGVSLMTRPDHRKILAVHSGGGSLIVTVIKSISTPH